MTLPIIIGFDSRLPDSADDDMLELVSSIVCEAQQLQKFSRYMQIDL